jgi:hypothetical protein
MSLNAITLALYTYKNLFDLHFTFSGTTFLRIWSKVGIFLYYKK